NYSGIGTATIFHINTTSSGSIFLKSNSWTPTLGTWYHLAVVKSGNSYTFYLNGVANGTATTTITVPDVAATFQVGRAEGAFYLNGQLDDLRLWNTALSASTIPSTMNAPLTGSESGLVGYWKFDDGGTSLSTTDSTSNQNNGTLGGRDATAIPAWTSSGAPS